MSDLALCDRVRGASGRKQYTRCRLLCRALRRAHFLLPVDLHLLDVSVLGQLVIPWLSFLSVATFERNAASLTFCWKCVRETWKRGGSVTPTEMHPTASGTCRSHIPAKKRLSAADVCPTSVGPPVHTSAGDPAQTSMGRRRTTSAKRPAQTFSRRQCEASAGLRVLSWGNVPRFALLLAHVARADGTSVHFGSGEVGCVCVLDGFGAAFDVGQRATRKAWPERRCVCVLGF